MYLRTLIGPRAGEVLNFSPEAARAMLADGRAILPDAEYPVVAPHTPDTAAVNTTTSASLASSALRGVRNRLR